jgi:hypothetical protein
MRRSTCQSAPRFVTIRLALLGAMAALLAGCQTSGPETTGSIGATAQSAQAAAEPAKPAELPMTRHRAAMECWMKTEKGSASVNIDKRADIVTQCIDDKLKSAAVAPKG